LTIGMEDCTDYWNGGLILTTGMGD